MSYEDTIKALKIISTVALGQYAGAAVYGAVAVQPALIEQNDVQSASMVSRRFWNMNFYIPSLCSNFKKRRLLVPLLISPP